MTKTSRRILTVPEYEDKAAWAAAACHRFNDKGYNGPVQSSDPDYDSLMGTSLSPAIQSSGLDYDSLIGNFLRPTASFSGHQDLQYDIVSKG